MNNAVRMFGILIVFILVSGCATQRYQNEVLAMVRDEERKTCEDFAGRESTPARLESREELGEMAFYLLVPGLNIFTAMGLPVVAHHHAKKRREIYDAAFTVCLKPLVLEAALGPNHLEVSKSLEDLANYHSVRGRYTQAEPLYRRALAIRDQVLGPMDIGTATRLEIHASLLRKIDREVEAEQLEIRAKAIRAQPFGANLPPIREK